MLCNMYLHDCRYMRPPRCGEDQHTKTGGGQQYQDESALSGVTIIRRNSDPAHHVHPVAAGLDINRHLFWIGERDLGITLTDQIPAGSIHKKSTELGVWIDIFRAHHGHRSRSLRNG